MLFCNMYNIQCILYYIYYIIIACLLQTTVYNPYFLNASNKFNEFSSSDASNDVSNGNNTHNAPNVVRTYNATKVLIPPCYNRIFCDFSNESVLHYVQMYEYNNDSKLFVDKILQHTIDIVLNNFKTLKEQSKNELSSKLNSFVLDNFRDDDEYDRWYPPDYIDKSPIFDGMVTDSNYREWAHVLNQMWNILSRKIKDDVKINQELYSLLWVPNGFIMPGGRFGELYYWDTYWIVNGLLVCNMTTTARGIIDNMIVLVKRFGYMPNGGRIYYVGRSQPPMLILMVYNYYMATKNFTYVQENIGAVEKEFNFWMNDRSVTFQKNNISYTMYRYYAPSMGPRPESYKEDLESAQIYNTEEEKNDFYSRIKSGTESGWDFSSRWFITANGSDRGILTDTQTPNIVPVDLNSLLHRSAEILSHFYTKLGSYDKAAKYDAIAKNIQTSIEEVMWSEDEGIWYDWDIVNNKSRKLFFGSNIVPLWTQSYCITKNNKIPRAVLNYLMNQKIIENDYSITFEGTPASMYKSSQQWDYHNAWPPLQAFIIQGLDRTNHKRSQYVALKLADVWLRTNYKGYLNNKTMFEKFDSLESGQSGSGGEYASQSGFGWTNGIVFEILQKWGDSLTYKKNEKIRTLPDDDESDLNSTCLDEYFNNF